MFAEILRFKLTGKRMIQEDDVLPRAAEPAIFVSTSCEERHNKPFWL